MFATEWAFSSAIQTEVVSRLSALETWCTPQGRAHKWRGLFPPRSALGKTGRRKEHLAFLAMDKDKSRSSDGLFPTTLRLQSCLSFTCTPALISLLLIFMGATMLQAVTWFTGRWHQHGRRGLQKTNPWSESTMIDERTDTEHVGYNGTAGQRQSQTQMPSFPETLSVVQMNDVPSAFWQLLPKDEPDLCRSTILFLKSWFDLVDFF